MKNFCNVIIAHPGKQHSFNTASALKKSSYLNKYVTTVYQKDNSITKKLYRFVNNEDKNKVNNRKSTILNENDVKQFYEVLGLITIIISRINKNFYEGWNNFVGDRFGKKVAKYAKQLSPDIVISYDNNSNVLFKRLENSNIIRILDVSAANRIYMQKIYCNDIKMCGEFSSLYGKTQLITKKKLLSRYKNEIDYADYFLVASSFVAESLLSNGVKRNQIKLLPYGVDYKKFNYSLKTVEPLETIRFLFVGNVNQIKGIYYLLEAFKKLRNKNCTLSIIGKYYGDPKILEPYKEFCEFISPVSHDEMPNIYKKFHILIFPSLGEGFGLTILEALASGLPVIASKNTAGSDIITSKSEGFIIPIQNIEAIIDAVEWFLNNGSEIPEMSLQARKTAEKYTWERYEKNLINILDEIIVENNKKSLVN